MSIDLEGATNPEPVPNLLGEENKGRGVSEKLSTGSGLSQSVQTDPEDDSRLSPERARLEESVPQPGLVEHALSKGPEGPPDPPMPLEVYDYMRRHGEKDRLQELQDSTPMPIEVTSFHRRALHTPMYQALEAMPPEEAETYSYWDKTVLGVKSMPAAFLGGAMGFVDIATTGLAIAEEAVLPGHTWFRDGDEMWDEWSDYVEGFVHRPEGEQEFKEALTDPRNILPGIAEFAAQIYGMGFGAKAVVKGAQGLAKYGAAGAWAAKNAQNIAMASIQVQAGTMEGLGVYDVSRARGDSLGTALKLFAAQATASGVMSLPQAAWLMGKLPAPFQQGVIARFAAGGMEAVQESADQIMSDYLLQDPEMFDAAKSFMDAFAVVGPASFIVGAITGGIAAPPRQAKKAAGVVTGKNAQNLSSLGGKKISTQYQVGVLSADLAEATHFEYTDPETGELKRESTIVTGAGSTTRGGIVEAQDGNYWWIPGDYGKVRNTIETEEGVVEIKGEAIPLRSVERIVKENADGVDVELSSSQRMKAVVDESDKVRVGLFGVPDFKAAAVKSRRVTQKVKKKQLAISKAHVASPLRKELSEISGMTEAEREEVTVQREIREAVRVNPDFASEDVGGARYEHGQVPDAPDLESLTASLFSDESSGKAVKGEDVVEYYAGNASLAAQVLSKDMTSAELLQGRFEEAGLLEFEFNEEKGVYEIQQQEGQSDQEYQANVHLYVSSMNNLNAALKWANKAVNEAEIEAGAQSFEDGEGEVLHQLDVKEEGEIEVGGLFSKAQVLVNPSSLEKLNQTNNRFKNLLGSNQKGVKLNAAYDRAGNKYVWAAEGPHAARVRKQIEEEIGAKLGDEGLRFRDLFQENKTGLLTERFDSLRIRGRDSVPIMRNPSEDSIEEELQRVADLGNENTGRFHVVETKSGNRYVTSADVVSMKEFMEHLKKDNKLVFNQIAKKQENVKDFKGTEVRRTGQGHNGNAARAEMKVPDALGKKFRVIKNPTDGDMRDLRRQGLDKFSGQFSRQDAKEIRATYDEDGNRYVWLSLEGGHHRTESELDKMTGLDFGRRKGAPSFFNASTTTSPDRYATIRGEHEKFSQKILQTSLYSDMVEAGIVVGAKDPVAAAEIVKDIVFWQARAWANLTGLDVNQYYTEELGQIQAAALALKVRDYNEDSRALFSASTAKQKAESWTSTMLSATETALGEFDSFGNFGQDTAEVNDFFEEYVVMLAEESGNATDISKARSQIESLYMFYPTALEMVKLEDKVADKKASSFEEKRLVKLRKAVESSFDGAPSFTIASMRMSIQLKEMKLERLVDLDAAIAQGGKAFDKVIESQKKVPDEMDEFERLAMMLKRWTYDLRDHNLNYRGEVDHAKMQNRLRRAVEISSRNMGFKSWHGDKKDKTGPGEDLRYNEDGTVQVWFRMDTPKNGVFSVDPANLRTRRRSDYISWLHVGGYAAAEEVGFTQQESHHSMRQELGASRVLPLVTNIKNAYRPSGGPHFQDIVANTPIKLIHDLMDTQRHRLDKNTKMKANLHLGDFDTSLKEDEDLAYQMLAELGYDGVVYENHVEGREDTQKDSISVIFPNSLKSVFHGDVGYDSSHVMFSVEETMNPDAWVLGAFHQESRDINFFLGSDLQTFVHEFAHAWKRALPEKSLRAAEKWAHRNDPNGPHRAGDIWTRYAEEKFANGFTNWVQSKSAKVPEEMKGTFTEFGRYVGELYTTGRAIKPGTYVDKTLRSVMEDLITAQMATSVDPEERKEANRRRRARAQFHKGRRLVTLGDKAEAMADFMGIDKTTSTAVVEAREEANIRKQSKRYVRELHEKLKSAEQGNQHPALDLPDVIIVQDRAIELRQQFESELREAYNDGPKAVNALVRKMKRRKAAQDIRNFLLVRSDAGRRLQSFTTKATEASFAFTLDEVQKTYGNTGFQVLLEALENPEAASDIINKNMGELGPNMWDLYMQAFYSFTLSSPQTQGINTVFTGAWTSWNYVVHEPLAGAVDRGMAVMGRMPVMGQLIDKFYFQGDKRKRDGLASSLLPAFSQVPSSIAHGGEAGWNILNNKIGDVHSLESIKGMDIQAKDISAWQRYILPRDGKAHKTFEAVLGKKKGELMRKNMEATIRRLGFPISIPITFMRASDMMFKIIAAEGHLNRLTQEDARTKFPGDKAAQKAHIKRALAAYKADNASIPNHIRQKVSEAASYNTFMDRPGTVGTHLLAVREKAPIIKLVFPFFNTLVNLGKRGLEMTPGVGLAAEAIWARDPSFDKFGYGHRPADIIAKQIEGSMMAAFLLLAFDEDEFTGALPLDRNERKQWRLEGKIPYAVKYGDKWISFQNIEPINVPFKIVADLRSYLYEGLKGLGQYEELDEKDQDKVIRDLTQAGTAIGHTLLNNNYMRTFNDYVDSRTSEEYLSAIGRTAEGALIPYSGFLRWMMKKGKMQENENGEYVPQVFDQLEHQVLPLSTDILHSMFGVEKNTRDKITVWGDPYTFSSNKWWEFWWPVHYSMDVGDNIDSEFESLGYYPSIPSETFTRARKRYRLDPDIHQQLALGFGAEGKPAVKKIIETSKGYQRMDKEAKVRILDRRLTAIRKKHLNKAIKEQRARGPLTEIKR